jgi:hypothetical protein
MVTHRIKIIFLTTFFFSSFLSAEPNICLTDFQEKLSKDSIEKIKTMRVKAFKHCLNCGTSSCSLKKWDEANKSNQMICNRLFCKPVKTSKKTLFISNENHGFGKTFVEFIYAIDASGNIKDIVLKDVKGEMDRKRAKSYLKDNLKALSYEPIEIDGKIYSLVDLYGKTGWNIYER